MDQNSAIIKLTTELQLPFVIEPTSLSNQQILDIHNAIKKKETCTLKDLATALDVSADHLRYRISSVSKKCNKLRGTAKHDFLQTTFNILEHPDTERPTTSTEIHTIMKESEVAEYKSKIRSLTDQIEQQQHLVMATKSTSEKMKSEILKRKRQTTSLSSLLQRKRKDYRLLKKQSVHYKNSLQVHANKLLKGKKKERDLKKNICLLEKKVKTLRKEVEIARKDGQTVQEQLKQTLEESERDPNENEEQLKLEISNLKECLDYCENVLSDNQSNVVETYDNDKKAFSNETALCVMNLLSEGVGVHHVPQVMKSVADLCQKTLSQLPSTSTINRMGDRRTSIAFSQMSQELANKSDTTLQSDETRKHGERFEVFSVRDDDKKEWVLGLRDMIDKSSDTCLQTLKTIVNDIEVCTTTETGMKILTNIKNTMSDRAATEKKFQGLLKEYREDLLPAIYSNWEHLTHAERESLSQMNNFYCGLHLLVNFAEVSDGIIRKFEFEMKEDERVGAEAEAETAVFVKKDESGAVRLVRTASKCLSRGGDDKSGCYIDFRTFLEEKYGRQSHKLSNLLVPFRGNRFNILFYNAEVIFYLADDIVEFFEKVNKPSNRLQKSVLYDIKEVSHLAILKGLGLCSKIVTAPFWRSLEDKSCTIEDASLIYQKLHQFLDKAKEDCSGILCETDAPFPDQVKKDSVYERLMKEDVYDGDTCAVLQLIFGTWHTLLGKAASDHLPEGKFANLEEVAAVQTKSTPTHNKFPERVFALLDALTRFRPAASTLCNEGYIMFSLNKTSSWLNSLSMEERNKYLDKSRKEGRDIRQKYLERIKTIKMTRREALKKKRSLLEKKEQDQVRQREDLVNDILYYGLWQYPETVDEQLKSFSSDTEKKKALKLQLQFRKIILGQKGDKLLFQFSEKGQQYSVEKLTFNLKALIIASLKAPKEYEHSFVGKRVVHYQLCDNVRTPYRGRVVSTVPGYPAWCNVVYDGDEAVYVYKLLDDYVAGDLEIADEFEVQQRVQPTASTSTADIGEKRQKLD